MSKPNTIDGYNEQVTRDCERVLVTLLRNLGPWKDSIFLVGGLTPRYLVPDRPPVVPPHAGTLDLDIVLDVVIVPCIAVAENVTSPVVFSCNVPAHCIVKRKVSPT